MTKALILILIAGLLPACTALHKSQPAAAIYDFGMQHAPHAKQIPPQPRLQRKSLLIADASTPSWLDNTAIHYRLLYHNPAQTHTYAHSRWIATPAALLTQQLRNRIVTGTQEHVIKDGSPAKADYVLQIELEEFTQLFDTISESRIVIGLRASLIERNTRKLLAQKDFSTTEKAPSADAAGAVFALSAASDRITDELVDWLTAELPRA
jgi:cholesterol transport system auxiliary component